MGCKRWWGNKVIVLASSDPCLAAPLVMVAWQCHFCWVAMEMVEQYLHHKASY